MKKMRLLIFPLVLSVIVLSALPLLAAELRLISTGKTAFVLQGYDLPKVGGIKAVIEYENMTDPVVQRGSIINAAPSPMFIANVNTPGRVILAALQSDNQFSGTGSIATISFKPVPGKTGTARLTARELATHEGQKEVSADSSPVSGVTDGEPDGTTNPSTDPTNTGTDPTNTGTGTTNTGTGTTNTGTGTTGGGAYLGAVSMPSDQSGKSVDTAQPEDNQDQQDQQQEPGNPPPQEPEPSADGDAQPVEAPRETERPQPGQPKFAAHKGLLDQVRELKEEKTPQTLTALFGAYSIPGVKQEPPLVLSDGKTVVKVHLNLPAAGKQSPNFALKGAKLVSLKNDEKDKWVIEALPAKNANDVRVTALQDEMMTEIPLTVAQPVSTKAVSPQGLWDEGAFALFLKDRGGDKAPQFDLNGDGVRNHVDDYIYTVNYLIRNPKDPKVKAEEGKQPKPPQLPVVPNAKPVRPK